MLPTGGQGRAGQGCLLVAVVVEAIVAAQGREGAQANGIREENLGAGIYPYLDMGQGRVRVKCPVGLVPSIHPTASTSPEVTPAWTSQA